MGFTDTLFGFQRINALRVYVKIASNVQDLMAKREGDAFKGLTLVYRAEHNSFFLATWQIKEGQWMDHVLKLVQQLRESPSQDLATIPLTTDRCLLISQLECRHSNYLVAAQNRHIPPKK